MTLSYFMVTQAVHRHRWGGAKKPISLSADAAENPLSLP